MGAHDGDVRAGIVGGTAGSGASARRRIARSHIHRKKPLPGRMIVQYLRNLRRDCASVACTRVSVETTEVPSPASSMRKFIVALAKPDASMRLNSSAVRGLRAPAGTITT